MKKKYLASYRILFALLGFSALVTEIATTIERSTFNPANFFSYFTVESNIIAVIALLAGAFAVFANKKSPYLDYFRGAATLYMVVTGIIFAVLLSGLDVELTAVPWDNIVLHYIIPVVMAIDWLMDPPKRRFTFREGLAWLIFPIVYLVYSLFRGAAVGWYPYPFLDPANGGYTQVTVTSLIIAAVGFVLVFVVTRIGKAAKK